MRPPHCSKEVNRKSEKEQRRQHAADEERKRADELAKYRPMLMLLERARGKLQQQLAAVQRQLVRK